MPLERERFRRQRTASKEDAVELAKMYNMFDKLAESSAGTKDLKARFELEKKMVATANEILLLGFIVGLSPEEQSRWSQIMDMHVHIASRIEYQLFHGEGVIPLSISRL